MSLRTGYGATVGSLFFLIMTPSPSSPPSPLPKAKTSRVPVGDSFKVGWTFRRLNRRSSCCRSDCQLEHLHFQLDSAVLLTGCDLFLVNLVSGAPLFFCASGLGVFASDAFTFRLAIFVFGNVVHQYFVVVVSGCCSG